MDAPANQSGFRTAPTLLLLVVAAILPYLVSVRGAYLRDDLPYIAENRVVTGERPIGDLWRETLPPRQPHGLWRPLTTATFRADRALFGASTIGPHIVSLLWHAAAVLLVYRLIMRTGIERRIAVGAAALFALHPTHVEAVSWISARSEAIAAVFGIGSMLLAAGRALPGRGLAAAVCAFLAVCAKESAVAFLPLTIAWSLTPGIAIERKKTFWIPLAIGVVAAVLTRAYFVGSVALDPGVRCFPELGFFGRAALALRLYGFDYFLMSFWPGKWRVDHPELFDDGAFSFKTWIGAFVVLLLVAVAMRAKKRGSAWIFFASSLYVVMLLPFSHLLQSIGETVAQRFFFMPSLAVALSASVLWHRILSPRLAKLNPPLLVHCVGWFLVVAIGGFTAWRASDYANEERLWRRELARHPDSPRAIVATLGHDAAAMRLSPPLFAEKMRQAVDRALAASPNHPEMLYRAAESRLGIPAKPAEAEAFLDRLAARNPAFLGIEILRAQIKKLQGNADLAIELLEKERSRRRADSGARILLAKISIDRRDYEKAESYLREAIPFTIAPPAAAQLALAFDLFEALVGYGAADRAELALLAEEAATWVSTETVDLRGRPFKKRLEELAAVIR